MLSRWLPYVAIEEFNSRHGSGIPMYTLFGMALMVVVSYTIFFIVIRDLISVVLN